MKLSLASTTRTATSPWRRSFSCPGLGDEPESNPRGGKHAAQAAYQRPLLAISSR